MKIKTNRLSRSMLNTLEEEFRSYPLIPQLKAEALVKVNLKHIDENWWIKANQMHIEPELEELLKKEDNQRYQYLDRLQSAIQEAYENLPAELQTVVMSCFWGDKRYYNWEMIGRYVLGISSAGIYRARYQILESLAKEEGIV